MYGKHAFGLCYLHALDILYGCESGKRQELAIELAVAHVHVVGHGVHIGWLSVIEDDVDAVGEANDKLSFRPILLSLVCMRTAFKGLAGILLPEQGTLLQQLIHARKQFVTAERFGEVGVGTGLKAPYAVGFGDLRRDDDYRYVACQFISP